jgi:protein O-mannosyl-transferase
MLTAPMPESKPESQARLLVPAIVLLATLAVFLPALRFGFVCDDSQQIVLNQARFTWHSIPSYFTTDVWSYVFLFKTNYYRPVFMLWLMLNYQLFGLDTGFWHASVIVAHLAATLLVYALALRLTGKRTIAGAAALLFGVHPVHVEAVAWLSGSTEPLFAIFALGAILCHLRWRDSDSQRLGWRAAEIGLFALAMFAKETAVVVPVLLCAWDWLFPIAPSASVRRRIGAAISSFLPHLLVIAAYFWARIHALGSFAPLVRSWTLPTMIGTWPLVLSFYVRQLLIPFQYSLFYPIAPVQHFGLAEAGLHLLPVLLAGCALVWISRRSPVNAACALLLVLPILPVLNLSAFTFDDFLHDRYVYLPSAGLCILAAIGIEKLLPRVSLRMVALLVVAGGLALVTVQTGFFWKDNLALYSRAVEVAPESGVASEYLSEEFVEEMRWADALPLLNQVLLRNPNSYDIYIRLAKCYFGLGDLEEAISYFQDAILLAPYRPAAYLDLAMVELSGNLLPQAEEHMRLALRLRPAYSPLFERYHYRLAQILEKEEKWSGALAEYRAELQEDPGSSDALGGFDRMQKQMAGQVP